MSEQLATTAYFGIPGSFTYGAAMKYFGETSAYKGGATFKDVFSMVKSGECQYGVIPIENTLAGSIYENYDLLDASQLFVTGEVSRRVEQSLLVSKFAGGVALDELTAAYSHPKALDQCSVFFDAHPHIEKRSFADTASAARFVSEQDDPTIAAIADNYVAEIYDLEVLQSNIEDNDQNFTRFLIVSNTENPDTAEADKCALIVHLDHVPGSLVKTLDYFYQANCSLTSIQSRPMPEHPFEYIFYMDFIYNPRKQDMPRLLQGVEDQVAKLRVLGLFKREPTPFAVD
ncbi:MAG TPA: prephenate dehydratase domain-containing protein [Candidatus Saccharimonadales bacterium]|nr:prephenate dehydratase domain-containing protein [Candidatus Saccharimonadales bacterium]